MALEHGLAVKIYCLLEFIVLFCIVVGTPTAQFVPQGGGCGCFTMWGYKPNCGRTHYSSRGINAFGCGQRKDNMTASAVFAIASIAAVLLAFLYGALMYLKKCSGFLIPALLTLIASATLLVCWACIAGVYNNSMCNCSNCSRGGKFKNLGYEYGFGFVLVVIAWCVQVLNCFFVVFQLIGTRRRK